MGFILEIFAALQLNLRGSQSFSKTNKQIKFPLHPPEERNTLDEQVALDASLLVKVPQAEPELEFGFLALHFFPSLLLCVV